MSELKKMVHEFLDNSVSTVDELVAFICSPRLKYTLATQPQVGEAQRLLESLTPGGSEFAGDAKACAAYVLKKISNLQDIAKNAVKRSTQPQVSGEQVLCVKLDAICAHLNHPNQIQSTDVFTAIKLAEDAAEWARMHIERRGKENDDLRALLSALATPTPGYESALEDSDKYHDLIRGPAEPAPVKLMPKTFQEQAEHFKKVTQPISEEIKENWRSDTGCLCEECIVSGKHSEPAEPAPSEAAIPGVETATEAIVDYVLNCCHPANGVDPEPLRKIVTHVHKEAAVKEAKWFRENGAWKLATERIAQLEKERKP